MEQGQIPPQQQPPPGPPAPGPPAPGSPAAPADLTVPKVGLALPRQRLSKLGKKGLALSLNASEPCSVTLELVIDAKTARALKLGRKSVTIGKLSTRAPGGRQTVNVKPSARVLKALKKSKRSVKLTLRGTARDDAGNAGPLSGRATLPR